MCLHVEGWGCQAGETGEARSWINGWPERGISFRRRRELSLGVKERTRTGIVLILLLLILELSLSTELSLAVVLKGFYRHFTTLYS